MKKFDRTERVAQLIHRHLAMMLDREVKDPRVGRVTVCEVEVTKDLMHAKIFVTTSERDDNSACIEALNKASGFMRSSLAQTLTMRTVPQLKFIYDDTIDKSSRISNILESIDIKSDEQELPNE